jgi:CRISPR-associated protein Csb2
MRGTLIKAADGNWPELLSGHRHDGEPTREPHLAFVPLADVGHPFATGTILGVALISPVDLDRRDRDTLHRTIAVAEQSEMPAEDPNEVPALKLTLGRHGVLHVRRLRDVATTRSLRAERWTRPARRWASVSAVALGRNPGNLKSGEPDVVEHAVANAEATIATDCINIGLPPPAAVWIHRRSLLDGAPSARRFMPFPAEGGGPRRVCVHAELVFHEKVWGPVILGAGRYFGLGLCSALDES